MKPDIPIFWELALKDQPIMVSIWDVEQERIIFLNEHLKEFLGLETDNDIYLRTLIRRVHPDDQMDLMDFINEQTFSRNDETPWMPLRVMDSTGRFRNIWCSTVKWQQQHKDYMLGLAKLKQPSSSSTQGSTLQQYKAINSYRRLLDALPVGVVVHDGIKFLYANSVAKDMLSASSVDQIIGRPWKDFVHTDDISSAKNNISLMMSHKKEMVLIRHKLLRMDGSTFHAEVGAMPVKWEGKDAILVYLNDITKQVQREERLKYLASVAQNATEGVVIMDMEGRITTVNKTFTRLTGYDEQDVLGWYGSRLLSNPDIRPDLYTSIVNTVKKSGSWSDNTWLRHKDGHSFPAWLTITVVYENKKTANLVASFSDLTQVNASGQRQVYLALHDPLTNLGNRAMLQTHLKHSINNARRSHDKVAVLFLDLDDFKDINDTHGHDAGDQILVEVSKRLVESTRDADIIARFGGDEFVIVEQNVTVEGVATTADRLLKKLNEPFIVSETVHNVGLSIGIALFPDDGKDPESLIKAADTAMYNAKELGKNRYVFYDHSLTDALMEQIALRHDMERGIESRQFTLYYQPQIDIAHNQAIGMEALVRWNHPQKGVIPPSRFIQIAEHSRLIIPLGRQVLRQACQQMVLWQQQFGFNGRVVVDVSKVQLEHTNIVETIEQTLRDTGLSPEFLEIEIYENIPLSIRVSSVVTQILNKINKLGIRIAIDNFGTGYASLSFLRQYHFDRLKIDRSLVRGLPDDPNACAFVDTVIAVARNLNMDIIAEGVETQAQSDYLLEHGCSTHQGYLYYKPLRVREVEKRILSHPHLQFK